jgi:predicted PurR-regulated permease PerM
VEWNRKNVRNLLGVIFAGIAFYVGLQHLNVVIGAVSWIFTVLSPFVIGGAIAFILNVPMRALERHLMPGAVRWKGVRRPLAYVLTLVLVFGVLALASQVIVPNVADAIVSLAEQIPSAFDEVQKWLQDLSAQFPILEQSLTSADMDWNSIVTHLIEMLKGIGNALLSSGSGFLSDLIGKITNFFIGFVFSVYVLLQKEKLGCQCRQCLYALLPVKAADRVLEILTLTERTFSGFLSGQCVEAVILGTLFVLSMSVLHIPYALLVGVMIALTALIPVVGAFIGCVLGCMLIVIAEPLKAVMFLILFLVLQQIEGNLIYPRVVGSSVGLPAIWVLVAVTLGGKLFGMGGMLVFIPLCSVLYILFREFIHRRLKLRGVPAEKWTTPSATAKAKKKEK